MLLNDTSAVVDNDFIEHIVESNITDDCLVLALRTIFSELNLTAVIHPLVHEKEVQQGKPRIELLKKEDILHVAIFSDIFINDPARKGYYFFLVKELYRHLRGQALPVNGEDILTYWSRRQSLGEIHSVSMCLVCGCGIFLSDDSDSKVLEEYVKRTSLGSIAVYKRAELVDKHLQEGTTKLTRHTRQSLSHTPNKQ